MDKREVQIVIRFVNVFGYVLLFAFLWLLIVPIKPYILEAGLDPSWMSVINYALLTKMRFGEEIIFTYGPLGVFMFPDYFYNKDTFGWAIFISNIYVLFLFWGFYEVLKEFKSSFKVIGVVLILIGLDIGNGFFWYFVPLLFVAVYLRDSRGLLTLGLGFFMAFSILVKFSHFPIVFLSVLSIDLYRFIKEKKYFPFYTLLVAISMFGLFIAIGQNAGDFWSYFLGSFQTLAGYSEAMQSSGPLWMIWTFLAIVLFMSVLIFRIAAQSKKIEDFLFFFIGLLVLFMAFKNGFVRHDAHVIAAFSGLAFTSGIFFLFYFKNIQLRENFVVFVSLLFLIVFISYSVVGYYRNIPFYKAAKTDIKKIVSNIFEVPKLLSKSNMEALEEDYNVVLKKIAKSVDIGDLKGSVDIYPWDQSVVIANGLDFHPRPLFQSYSVYTSYLIEKNRTFLKSIKKPDTILFSIKEIDGRLPSMMEGASWLDLMSLYDIVDYKGEFLVLNKSNNQKSYTIIESDIQKVQFDQMIEVPDGEIFLKIDFEKDFLGLLCTTLFKAPILKIELIFDDNSSIQASIVPGVAKEGFILSPSIDNIYDFYLYASGLRAGKKVKFLKLINDSKICYKNNIKLQFATIEKKGFSLKKPLRNLGSLLIHERLVKENEYLDHRLFCLEWYENNEILFAHLGVEFELNSHEARKLFPDGEIRFGFGFKRAAYEGGNRTKGGCFNVYESTDKERKKLIFQRCLNPLEIEKDRREQYGSLVFDSDATKFVFESQCRVKDDSSWGWSYWRFNGVMQ